MGVFSDLLAQANTFKASSPLGQFLTNWINGKADPDNTEVAEDAVHSLSAATQTSGNFTLTFTLRNGETFTTGNIAFDDSAATIEGLIDTAATAASITDWTNGDISVSGGAVNSAPVVFTFDGDSVSGTNHPITVLDDVDGAGGAWGTVSITTDGQTDRVAWGMLLALGAISGSIPTQTADASATAVTLGPNAHSIPAGLIRDLAKEAAAEDDNNNSYWSIMRAFRFQHSPAGAEQLGESTLAVLED